MTGLSVDDIVATIAGALPGIDGETASEEGGAPEVAWGDRFLFYDPDRILDGTKRFPFVTIVIKDYPGWDEASNLNREGVFRLNIGISKETFASLFGDVAGTPDYTAIDMLMPHPVYAGNHWVSVLNLSASTFATVMPLLTEAHAIAQRRYPTPH